MITVKRYLEYVGFIDRRIEVAQPGDARNRWFSRTVSSSTTQNGSAIDAFVGALAMLEVATQNSVLAALVVGGWMRQHEATGLLNRHIRNHHTPKNLCRGLLLFR